MTMDLKQPGNLLYLVGETQDELGGSHFALVNGLAGGQVPTVDPKRAKRTFAAVHAAIDAGLVRACHDLSEGGLAVARPKWRSPAACGATIDVGNAELCDAADAGDRCCSANRTRGFLCEVEPATGDRRSSKRSAGVPLAKIGECRPTSGRLSRSRSDGKRC